MQAAVSAPVAGRMPAYACPTAGCPKKVLVRALGHAVVEVKCPGCKQLVVIAVVR